MSSKFMLPALFVVLAACASTGSLPDDAQVVPSKLIVTEIAQRPYECYKYDVRTDSCEAIARRTVSESKMIMDASVSEFVSGIGTLNLTISTTFAIRETTFCGNLGASEITVEGGVLPSNFREAAIQSAKRKLRRDGVKCYTYLRDPSGQYYNVEVDRTGKLKSASDDKVWFFASPKPTS